MITREKRIRRLVRKLNRSRKAQAAKIDILCNDIVGAHRKSLEQLRQMSLLLDYYEKVLGCRSLDSLLDLTADHIQDSLLQANIAIYCRGQFRTHILDSDVLDDFDGDQLESCFTAELCSQICCSNKCLDADALLQMGLQINPRLLQQISLAAIPLTGPAHQKGFIILYRSSVEPFIQDQLKSLCWLIPALDKAIESCPALDLAQKA